MKISRTIMTTGAGAGIGVIQTIVFKEYIDPNFGPIPGIGTVLPYPWGNWSTFGNILIGGVVFGLSQFTKVIKNKDLNNFLTIYGISVLIGGIMNGVFPGAPAARAGARARAPVRLAPRGRGATVAPLTQTGIPPVRVLA